MIEPSRIESTRIEPSRIESAKYWTLVRLTAAGRCVSEEVAAAKAFVQSLSSSAEELQDARLQRQLWQLRQQPATQELAELCLRCFISGQIEQVCLRLERQFGSRHGFTRQELLPLVLDEAHATRGQDATRYQSLASKILQTYNPERSGLATWISRIVQSHPDLNTFLLEHGVYQVSDWAILNSYTPKRVRQILSELYRLPIAEVKEASALLDSYHAVYRHDRHQQLQSSAQGATSRCQPPTPEQLSRIAQRLHTTLDLLLPPSAIQTRLLTLATWLRKHSIWVRGGPPPTESLELPEVQRRVEQHQDTPIDADDSSEFLQRYRQQFLQCSEQAIQQVMQSRQTRLRQKASAFLTALRLFYCQGKAMGEIAPLVGLKAQYQVTRLLELKAFRADIRHCLLERLRGITLDLARSYAHPERLQALDQQIEAALDEQIERVIGGCPVNSLFAKQLCRQLEANPEP